MRYRHKYLAHEDLKQDKIFISHAEIKKVFDSIAEILNIYSNQMDFSSSDYSFVVQECRHSTQDVISFLSRFERYRLEEINRELGLK